MDVQELCLASPNHHWMLSSGEMVPSLTSGSTQESGPSTSPSGVGLCKSVLRAQVWSVTCTKVMPCPSLPPIMSLGELALPLTNYGGGVMPSLPHPSLPEAVSRTGPGVMRAGKLVLPCLLQHSGKRALHLDRQHS